ncbi:MAG: glycosyltransferase family 2 protein [Clostridia bacterium]|nr:glycosyltransferase family 2 protein [Clostridia bacterium]
MDKPVLYLVIPCFNEQEVLPVTAPLFLKKLEELCAADLIDEKSRILFVNDGSRDATWQIISDLAKEHPKVEGLSLSRNYGHQNALLAGLMYAKDLCDITISIDCDGQDDMAAMDEMVRAYLDGCDVVYGVRSDRKSDSFFKRTTAQLHYRIMHALGAQTIYNHADYRLLSARALEELSKFREVNIYLRGMVPLVGFKSTCVYYKRTERLAGKTHYSLSKMMGLALDGITSLSTKPLRIVTVLGFLVTLFSFACIIWAIVMHAMDSTIAGWTSLVALVCFLGGIQLLAIGIIGEYVGRIYLETKGRPRYIIKETTESDR